MGNPQRNTRLDSPAGDLPLTFRETLMLTQILSQIKRNLVPANIGDMQKTDDSFYLAMDGKQVTAIETVLSKLTEGN